ncbi:MAG: vitamin B12 dependent-methionine synthase activation domain-containing protein [Candidatus Aminicenantes bacterium]
MKTIKSNSLPSPFPLTVVTDVPLDKIFSHINPQRLFGKHFGLKGNYQRLIKEKNQKAVKLTQQVKEVQALVIEKNLITPKAVYRFFKIKRNGASLAVLNENEEEIETLTFSRQEPGHGVYLYDYFPDNTPDIAALFCATAGEGIARAAAAYRERAEYTTSHIISILSLECAEALADLLHQRIMAEWGASLPGCRFSPGYPLWPFLDHQLKLFKLLEIKKSIGVTLTDGLMMDPPASVTAMVVKPPETMLKRQE